jgi:hypothetical protein
MRQPEFELPIADSSRAVMSVAELWSTAIHEAGHAVVAVYYEIPFTAIFIKPNGDGGLILDRRKDKHLLPSPARVRYASKLIVTGYSGYISQHKVAPATPRGGERYDAEHVGGLLWETTRHDRKFDRSTGCFRQPTEAEAEQKNNRITANQLEFKIVEDFLKDLGVCYVLFVKVFIFLTRPGSRHEEVCWSLSQSSLIGAANKNNAEKF